MPSPLPPQYKDHLTIKTTLAAAHRWSLYQGSTVNFIHLPLDRCTKISWWNLHSCDDANSSAIIKTVRLHLKKKIGPLKPKSKSLLLVSGFWPIFLILAWSPPKFQICLSRKCCLKAISGGLKYMYSFWEHSVRFSAKMGRIIPVHY